MIWLLYYGLDATFYRMVAFWKGRKKVINFGIPKNNEFNEKDCLVCQR